VNEVERVVRRGVNVKKRDGGWWMVDGGWWMVDEW
jgi:hypothetical protein